MEHNTMWAFNNEKGLLQESQGLESKTPLKSSAKGEEPVDKARKRQLGEEPGKSQLGDNLFQGQRLSDIYVLELLLEQLDWPEASKRRGSKA